MHTSDFLYNIKECSRADQHVMSLHMVCRIDGPELYEFIDCVILPQLRLYLLVSTAIGTDPSFWL